MATKLDGLGIRPQWPATSGGTFLRLPLYNNKNFMHVILHYKDKFFSFLRNYDTLKNRPQEFPVHSSKIPVFLSFTKTNLQTNPN